MAYAIGLSALRALCEKQSPLDWQLSKLTAELFRATELPVFEWVNDHLKKHHALPQLETLEKVFPELAGMSTPEPASYYVGMVENRFYLKLINDANLKSQQTMDPKQGGDQDDHAGAISVLKRAVQKYTAQRYRHRILDVGKELPGMILNAYHNIDSIGAVAGFGWPYMDEQGGAIMPGEMVSFVGRPAMGKTWLTLWTAIYNWKIKKQNVMFVSMEMGPMAIGQRIAAMYTGCPISQLKVQGFATPTYLNFFEALGHMGEEAGKLYVVDGNLAAQVDDIYVLADMFACAIVVVDGAYLLKNPNTRLDRYQRVADNCERMKQVTSDLGKVTFCSWQLNREAEKKKKEGKQVGVAEIGYSDAIGQISAICLGLFQEDSAETVNSRKITVMKGRNGETGELRIAWNFTDMDFSQVDPPIESSATTEGTEAQWL